MINSITFSANKIGSVDIEECPEFSKITNSFSLDPKLS